MSPTMPTRGRQARRRAVTWWHRFHGAFRMLCLLAVGVVALGVAANAAPAKRQVGRPSGPAPIALEQIVAAGSSVFALASDRQGVYKWSEHQENWQKVKDRAQKLYAGGDTVYAIEPGRGDISKYGGVPGSWKVIGGPGATFAATSKHLYGVSPNLSGVYQYTDSAKGTGQWRRVGDRAEHLYAGPGKALYATNPADKKIFKYDGKWTHVGDAGATFAVTDNNLYGLTPDRQAVVEYDSKKKKWKPVGGPAADIFASNTLYKVERGTGALWKYNGRPHDWNFLSDRATAFVTSGDHLFRLAPDRRSVQKYSGNGKTNEWRTLGAPAAGPAPSPAEKNARYASMNQHGEDSRKIWTAARDEHLRGVPDPYEFRWSTNYCNFSPDIPGETYDFRNACARHDFLSRNYRDLYGENSFRNNSDGQKQIDHLLWADLRETCKNRYPGSQQACEVIAYGYYNAVAGVSAVNRGFDPGGLVKGFVRPFWVG
ncbi:phospholipase A2 [Streptomyces erythrochromogenes]|uniref:phospholipase A2 n=1 Tax=Streptomyces erythrochromogenes TaxID=285574 RepID=UPI0036FE58F0